MRFPNFRRMLHPATLLLAGWVLFCLIWAVTARRPWQTRAFAPGGVRQVPVREYMAAGVWIGLVISGCLCLVALGLQRWWGKAEAAPLRPALPGTGALPRGVFAVVLTGILAFALWQRWPGMSHSFWGDEGWMFCDYIHGKWQAAEKGGSTQSYLHFNTVPWIQAVFGDQSGNNHWLATDLQRLTLKAAQILGGHPDWWFRESVVRLVPLSAGLASLAALAGWLRWMGRPLAGLVATAFMALHPWHVRFSLEARGYSLMLFFFILTLWALMKALRDGRLRDWVLFGLGQFFMMYSWKGGVYALVFVNAVLAVRLLRGPVPEPRLRAVALARWALAGLVGAMLFLPLAVPSELQIRKSIAEVRNRAKPMDAGWTRDAAAEILTGMPWAEYDTANPREVSLQRLGRQHGWTWPAVAVLTVILLLGLLRLWRQDRLCAWLCLAVLASAPVAALHFKYSLKVELLTWYLLYLLPPAAVFVAFAVTPAPGAAPGRRLRLGWTVAAAASLTGFSALGAPMIRDTQHHPREALKGAWKITRGRHESRGFRDPSPIFTAWLWRHTHAYDPRADMYVRSREALEAKIAQTRAAGGEFYMIVGYRALSEKMCPDVMAELRDPAKFELVTTLWGVEPLNTLEVYHLRKDAPP